MNFEIVDLILKVIALANILIVTSLLKKAKKNLEKICRLLEEPKT